MAGDFQQRLRDQRDLFNQEHSTRLHRAISWWRAANEQGDSADLQFITAWISLSCCCLTSDDGDDDFLPLMETLVQLDEQQQIYHLLWHTYSGPVKALIKNPFVYRPFWQAQRGQLADWRGSFERSSVEALNCLSRRKVPELLAITLDRLSVLRNQVMGGGATYGSSVNRDQVVTGAELLMSLLPVIFDLMLSHPEQEWGALAYPVISASEPNRQVPVSEE